MKQAIESLCDPNGDVLAGLAELVARLRPSDSHDAASAAAHLRALCFLLQGDARLRAGLRNAIRRLLSDRYQISLYTTSGILPGTGFFSESSHRLVNAVLPEVLDPTQLRDALRIVFDRPGDAIWVEAVPDEVWVDLLVALRFDEEARHAPPQEGIGPELVPLLEALRVMSYWISAAGLEPELRRIEPALDRHELPFLAQNEEVLALLAAAREGRAAEFDARHLAVLLDQCHDWLDRIRRKASQIGTSLTLTLRLRRLRQMLGRMQRLLEVFFALVRPGPTDWLPVAALFRRLVASECRRNDLRSYWRENIGLLALRVTENASKAGEHYISTSRQEYFTLLRSALGAGVIIAFMALVKLGIAKLHLAPLNAGLAVCLNYGLGFVLIHLLHFTVATKQPAMTANAIAASLGDSRGRASDLENLATLVARTVRSQLGAIFGNIALAVPTAILLSAGIAYLAGHPPANPEKARALLAEVHPYRSGALIYAAIAGVCLFLSGLIAGFFDNLSAYDRIPERLQQVRWLRRLLGERRLARVSEYVGNNLGALAGNFLFGFLLGGASTLGVLHGLPIDIRHVAFSSAYLGYALVGLDFAPDPAVFFWAAFGVLLIGLTNLVVSFALALNVALNAREIRFTAGPRLRRAIGARLRQSPREFLLPPRRSDRSTETA